MQTERMDKAIKQQHNKHYRQFMKSKRDNLMKKVTATEGFFNDERSSQRYNSGTYKSRQAYMPI